MPGKLLRVAAPLAVVGVGLLVLATSGVRPPRLPSDGDHGLATSELRCLTCHGGAGRRPRPPDHPPRDDCFSCHRDASGVLHPRVGAATSLAGGWRDDPRLNPVARPGTRSGAPTAAE